MTTLRSHSQVRSAIRTAAASATVLVGLLLLWAIGTFNQAHIQSSSAQTPSRGGYEVQNFARVVDASRTLAVIYEQNLGAHSEINLFDHTSGVRLAQIRAADSPLVLVRTSRNELLVSDVPSTFGNGRGDPLPRLLILDLNDQLRARGEPIAMPDRTMYPIYSPSMGLSSDERFLYYMKRRDCGFLCNEVSVGIIDLDHRTQFSARLPDNCGHIFLSRKEASGMTAMCPIDGSLWSIAPDGGAKRIDGGFATPGLAAGIAPQGGVYWISMRGDLVVRDTRGNVVLQKELLASRSGALTGIYRWYRDGHLFLGLKASPSSEDIAEVIDITIANWTVSRLEVPQGTSHLAPLGSGRLAFVGASPGPANTVTIADAATSQRRESFSVPSGRSPWIVSQ